MKVRPEIYDMLPYDRSVDLSNVENPTFDMKVVSSSNYLGNKEKSIKTDNFGIIAQELYTIPEFRSLVKLLKIVILKELKIHKYMKVMVD